MEQQGEEKMKQKVMVAFNESELSQYALEWTLKNLGSAIHNSELLVFTAQPVTIDFGYTAIDEFCFTPELIAAIQENYKKVALNLLHKAKTICANYGITARTVTEIGDPKKAICEAVEKLNIDLLVLGSHGRGIVQRAFLGSVSNYCVHNAGCTVLVVRKPI
ncbi:universal stress protein A-like protein isoform X1 [Argentina anserina]|uniref:universal stress protein A-like protein isoform X1 n=1 Tax=Argentina anserina TaxID=57926 RepID=UPI002176923F|nr:universal stress protein A-like protein isoform X1 [Potentilla anserina]